MSDGLLVLFDAIAVLIMVFCLYFPRHGRKDMIVALFAINIGVLGVSFTLADAAVSAGLDWDSLAFSPSSDFDLMNSDSKKLPIISVHLHWD